MITQTRLEPNKSRHLKHFSTTSHKHGNDTRPTRRCVRRCAVAVAVAVRRSFDGVAKIDACDEQIATFARWTNLSETTFVLDPTDASADYRLRIFTPTRELPFAGHPALGPARAWLDRGGRPARPGELRGRKVGVVARSP